MAASRNNAGAASRNRVAKSVTITPSAGPWISTGLPGSIRSTTTGLKSGLVMKYQTASAAMAAARTPRQMKNMRSRAIGLGSDARSGCAAADARRA